MTMLIGAFMIVGGIIILNGFAAGIVAALHFWGRNYTVAGRAAWGALASGVATVVMLAGAMFAESQGGRDGVAVATALFIFIVLAGFLVALPGAYVLSRKIGSNAPINPDTFA